MIKFIDNRLNSITMYRLILYYLIVLIGVAAVLSAIGTLQFNPASLLFSTLFIIAVCWVTNRVFASAFRVPANVESVYISALILVLIIDPAQSSHDLWFLLWASVWAMASKYIIAINRKHLFNPVAFAVALTAITINGTASWWVGTLPMLPFVLIGGLLIVRKIQRFEMVLTFVAVSLVVSVILTVFAGQGVLFTLQQMALYSPLIFFAAVILTEPLTTPPTIRLQVIYAALVGLLFSPQFHIRSFYTTPEIAILIGNVFSYLVSPKAKLILRLKEKIQTAPDTFDFVFSLNRRLSFAPGQYMEWTLGHDNPDSRGNRRYFTLASSPTERELILGVKFYPNSSSYKRAMLSMDTDSEIVAAQLAGDFTLPKDPKRRLVFIAGGIGITPFRSMIQYLMDTRQKRAITLLYSNRNANEIVYKDVFDKAQRAMGLKTIYTLTDANNVPANWKGKVGRITPQMIAAEVPYYRDCIYYLSGPNAMVESYEEALLHLHVHRDHIRTDFFPGFA